MDFLRNEDDEFDDLADRFYEIYPNLKHLKNLRDERNIMAYGAGDFGNRAAEFLKDRLELYVDQRAESMEFQKNGRKVIPLDQITKYNKKILITMSDEKIAGALENLLLYGLKDVYVCEWDV